jgi:hypothetical protein
LYKLIVCDNISPSDRTKEKIVKKLLKYVAIAVGLGVAVALFQRNKQITRGAYKKKNF